MVFVLQLCMIFYDTRVRKQMTTERVGQLDSIFYRNAKAGILR